MPRKRADVRDRLEALVGKTLVTLKQRKLFDVIDVSRQWVIVCPRAGNGNRKITRERIGHIAMLNVNVDRLRQKIVEQYPDTRNSSYMAAIVAEITK